MAIIVNWVDQPKLTVNHIELPALTGSFVIYYVDEVITKTEWRDEPSTMLFDMNSQWAEVQRYLNNPIETLTVTLKKQGTAFRNKVWAEICNIPVGQTRTYSQLAKQVNSGARAVANACRDNPFPGIIPCHRVVAVSGVGGYMGQTSGSLLAIKLQLLALESISIKEQSQAGAD